jgi:hypothetical protein
MGNAQINKRVAKTATHSIKGVAHSAALTTKMKPSANALILVLWATMGDVASSRLLSGAGNAMANLAGKILKTKEMELKYGQINPETQNKNLELTA